MKKIQLISIFCLSLSLSCEDQPDSLIDDLENDVNAAKAYFENEVENSENTNASALRKGKSRKSLKKNLQWDQAYYKSVSFGKVIIVPISFDEPLYIPKGDHSLSLNQLTYAMFHRSRKGHKLYWVTAIPDQAFLSHNDGLEAFTGTVFVEDWYGNYIQGFRHTLEGATKIEVDSNSRMDGECEVVSIFYCSVVCDSGGCGDITCNYSHDEVTCPDDSGGSGMPSSGDSGDYSPDENGSGGSSGDGPGSGDFPNRNWEQTFGKLCADMNFLYSAQSFKAEVIGLGGTWYNADFNYAINVELGVNCIDLPEYYISTTYNASNAFTIIFNNARTQIERELELGLLEPNSITIKNRLVAIITSNMQSQYPGSTFGLSECLGSVPTTTANYGC